MKRHLSIILMVLLACSMAGCENADYGISRAENQLGAYSNTGEEEKQVLPARDHISMVYYEDMDCNPLTTTNSENHELLKLVYSPLIRLNGALVAEYVLAEGVEAAGTEVKITLRSGLLFSDGSPLTASDVAASFKTVRASADSPYAARLANVKSFSVIDERTLAVTLKEPDADFINCLDIPVMQQKGSAGCGPYQFSEMNGKRVLIPNPYYFIQPQISVIELKKPADEQERQNMFSVGLLDVYFTPAESSLVFSSGKDYRVQTYPGDNLLYLGVNCRNGVLSRAEIRAFLNTLIEREKITDTVLLGQAQETAYPFQPAWYKAEGLTQEKAWTDLEKKEQAAALGLNLTENSLQDENGAQLAFTLLVAEESAVQRDVAQAVADSLALSGIKISLEKVSRAEYNTRLAAGQFDLYLGEVKTGRTLNTALYAAGSGINYGGFASEELEGAAAQYRIGSLSLTEYAAVFDRYTPLFPLAYRQGVLFAASDIGTFQSTGTWALYGDITKLTTLETEIKS